jgi:hypothetical protein
MNSKQILYSNKREVIYTNQFHLIIVSFQIRPVKKKFLWLSLKMMQAKIFRNTLLGCMVSFFLLILSKFQEENLLTNQFRKGYEDKKSFSRFKTLVQSKKKNLPSRFEGKGVLTNDV